MIYKIVFSTMIAIAALAMLFGMMQLFSSDAASSLNCKLHKNVIRYIPLPGFAERPLPDKCRDVVIGERQEVATLTNPLLADYIIKCWEMAEEGMYGKDLECFEIYAKGVGGTINESEVTNTIQSLNKCSTFPNDWLEITNAPYSGSCGTGNKTIWKMADPITSGTTLIIKYNPLAHWVEVI
ncbi:MAG: hypothetical protein ABIG84_08495 [archaeon]